MMKKSNLILVVACIVAWAAWKGLFAAFAQAPRQTVEAVAAQVARDYNMKNELDEVTASSSAMAAGKNVTFTNVLRVRKGLPASKLDEFKAALYADVLPKTCAANKEVFSWRKGVSYTFVYDNTYGERLAKFVVDERACGFK